MGDDPAALVEELLQGEWRNIGTVVHSTLRALSDVVKAQGAAIRGLEAQLASRPSTDEVERALLDRPSVDDVNRALADVAASMDRKVERADIMPALERQAAAVAGLQSTVQGTASAQRSHDDAELGALRRETAEQASTIHALRQELESLRTQVERKAERGDVERVRAEAAAGLREVDAALKPKLDRDELTSVVPRMLDGAVARKVDYDALQAALREVATRAELAATVDSRMSELRQSVEAQVKFAAQTAEERATHLQAAMDMRLAELRHQVTADAQLHQQQAAQAHPVGMAEVSRMLDSTAQAAEVHQLLATKADKAEVAQVSRAVCDRVSSAELTTQLQQSRDLVLRDVRQLLARSQEEVVEALNKKAYAADVHRALQQKAGLEQMDDVHNELRACARSSDLREVMEAVDRKADKEEMLRQLSNKAEHADLVVLRQTARSASLGVAAGAAAGMGGDDEVARSEIGSLRKEVARKADLEAVESMLDTRPTVKAVNDILRQLTIELDAKASDEAVAQVAADAAAIYQEIGVIKQHVNSELSVARFIWKSGRVCEDRAVPWNLMVVNTNTDAFVWRKDSSGVTCVTPGLYEVSAAFFSAHEPTVQLLVNGEPVISSEQPLEARPTRRGRHSAGCVTSVGFSQFLALPARATVAVTYSLDDGAQGFLGFRKL